MSPHNAFQFIQGLETLPLRFREHCRNARAVAQYWSTHPEVETVTYPGLKSGEEKWRADAIFDGGYGGLVGFELKGGLEAGRQFIDALRCSTMSPISAMRGRWRSIRRPRRTASWTPRSSWPPVSRTAMSACRWASSISTTSSRTRPARSTRPGRSSRRE